MFRSKQTAVNAAVKQQLEVGIYMVIVKGYERFSSKDS